MTQTNKIAVIGAGLAGLTAASQLVQAGRDVTLFDKGRGIGGRMASRRKDGWRFDHGAIALRPTEDGFATFIADSQSKAHAAPWEDAGGWTGLPGMSGTVKPVAAGLTIHTQSEVTELRREASGWTLLGPDAAAGLLFDHVILAIPQPQTHRLLAVAPALQSKIEAAEMEPCWTLMAGFDTALPTDISYKSLNDCPISVIAREGAKPGRDLPGDAWVVQASADWSRRHLEWERADVEGPLLQAFFDALSCPPATPSISMVHRWRYAQTSKPLGQPYLSDAELCLSICGDWCLGRTAQEAFNSGSRLARFITSQ